MDLRLVSEVLLNRGGNQKGVLLDFTPLPNQRFIFQIIHQQSVLDSEDYLATPVLYKTFVRSSGRRLGWLDSSSFGLPRRFAERPASGLAAVA